MHLNWGGQFTHTKYKKKVCITEPLLWLVCVSSGTPTGHSRGLFMANPQPDKFTKFSNELLEALMMVKMSGSEWQFIMCLFRKTYGYNKKEDWITNSQICKAIGLSKERVSEAKKRLLKRKIVTEKRNKISIQKDYDQWIELRKSVTVVTEKRNKVLRKSVNTKEKKENTTKDISKSGVDKSKNKIKSFATVVDMSNYNPLGAEIIFELIKVDPKNKTYYGNKTQRAACDFLIEEYGLQKVKEVIAIVEKTNGTPYFPTITTPVQLRDKWVALEKALLRYQKEIKNNNVAF